MPINGRMKNRLPFVECPLCGRPCEVKTSKRGLPYWQCAECKVQVFVRSESGARRLRKIITKES